jgi:hypothetical protein
MRQLDCRISKLNAKCSHSPRFLYRIILFSIGGLVISLVTSAQILDQKYSTDWSIVGINENRETNPKITQILNNGHQHQEFDFVDDLGGDYSGKSDNSELLNYYLAVYSGPVKIKFPSGTFLFTNTVNLRSNVILEGYSPTLTIFKFDLNNENKNLFNFIGQRDTVYHKVKESFLKGDNKIIVNGLGGFQPGDDIDLEQRNGDYMFYYKSHDQPWAEWSVGQMMKIKKILKDTLIFDRSLTNTYRVDLDLRISKVNMVNNVLLEKFSVLRMDKGLGNNFFIYHASNVKIKCMVSKFASRAHVRIERSRNIELFGNYFYDAQFHCGGGAGYGILIKSHSTECLVTNNIFLNLRHSMIVKEGANRNVFSYNYSSNVKISDGDISKGYCQNERLAAFPDISIHGHYSYMNLFEGNIVQAIHSADNWGPTGPGTTFFRNLIESDYGLKIWMDSEVHNVIGNVLLNGYIELDTAVKKTIFLKNFIKTHLYSNYNIDLPNSLYLKEVPVFYPSTSWPSIDPDSPGSSTNPAKERWSKKVFLDEFCCGHVPGLNTYITSTKDLNLFYENGYLYTENNNERLYNLFIYDLKGTQLSTRIDIDSSSPSFIGILKPGLYIALLQNQNEYYRVKFVVKN